MMNPASNTVAQLDPNSIENRHVVDASQGPISSYLPSTRGSEAVSWTTHRVENHSTESSAPSSFTYGHGQHSVPPSQDAQDGLNATSLASSSSLGTHSTAQQYNGYAAYNPTDQYGYGNTGYAGYYSSYQQQPSNAYSQPAGAYQNTGAPYQSLSSFQNSGSYAGSASYSTTYYNPGDYQTAEAYPSSSYNNQTASWNGNSYANYTPHQYPNYAPDTGSAYSSSSATASSQQYHQHYKQWADYYSQTEVTCAPGTENISVTSTSDKAYTVPAVSGGYPSSNIQTPSSVTPSWMPASSSSNTSSLPPPTPSSDAQGSYWQYGAPSLQNHLAGSAQPQYQKRFDPATSYNSFQDQQKTTVPHGSNYQYAAANQVPQSYAAANQAPQSYAAANQALYSYHAGHQAPQSYQPSAQAPLSSDTRGASKLQIPTNPRIASNLPLKLPKTDKETSTVGTVKPAYISVSLPKPNVKVSSDNASDSVLKSGMFPSSLRGYVERALARCKDDAQKAASQAYMKEMITNATADGTLYTRDWDTEPLFPIPDANAISNDNQQCSIPISSFPKFQGRRTKSRWEPLPEEKLIDNIPVITPPPKSGSWLNVNERERKLFGGSFESKENGFSSAKFSSSEQRSGSKSFRRSSKRQRMAGGSGTTDNGEASSDSDKEQNLTAYHSGARTFLDTPEERRRRENRSKRFEKGQGNQSEASYSKEKTIGAVNLYSRRETALMLSKNFDDGGNQAVEDIDWDALTVKGTCQEIEKRYLRLTSAPDPATVRPEEVLEKALLMVQNSQKNYLYKCDQLKSIRQDLTVQRIRNKLTVKVYETHARLALEAGDFHEYNQCQSQLKSLYAEGIEGCHMEFSAYSLLYIILRSNNKRDLLSLMSRLSDEVKKDEAVKHALAVHAAVTSGNYVTYFRLYKKAPNLNTSLMDGYVEKMRYKAVSCMSRAYRPTLPVSYIAHVLGFTSPTPSQEGSDNRDSDGIEECVEWLKAHGACLITDSNGELQLDAKASSSCLYMPEPEDAVPHGDANLAVNDFLTRMPQ